MGSGVERSACVRVSKIADVKIMPSTSSSTPVRKLHWGCRKSAQSAGTEEDKRSEEHLSIDTGNSTNSRTCAYDCRILLGSNAPICAGGFANAGGFRGSAGTRQKSVLGENSPSQKKKKKKGGWGA